MAMLTDRLTAAWNALPAPSRSVLRRSGIPYVGSYLASYRARYGPERFAGTLPALVDEYHRSTGPAREVLAWRFHDVLDSLVLPNGVRKTTWPRRHQHAVEAFLARADRPPDGTPLRVLDLPCSSGAASRDTRALLERCYGIRTWVLADLCMEVRLDADRGCVYDAAGELLRSARAEASSPSIVPMPGAMRSPPCPHSRSSPSQRGRRTSAAGIACSPIGPSSPFASSIRTWMRR